MLVIDMGEEKLHTLRLLRAVVAHAIVGLILEVDVELLVLVQQFHLLASRLQHLLRHFRRRRRCRNEAVGERRNA